ncbi:MAG: hypothetical protein HZB16_18195 [Armatimonadetes bacterium]|nr:hypothetical protein [Armatimonadota bacterium]
MLAPTLLALILAAGPRVPVIDVTDLYHPHQDVGDNLDILTAYALPEIDLRAVILDCTERFRLRDAGGDSAYTDKNGPREPGFIPVAQLNWLFGRHVPCAVGPTVAMRSPDDDQRDLPAQQQAGVDLLLETLRRSTEKVHVLSFGSARPIAVAWLREPQLLRDKVARIHLCAGDSAGSYLEWNVALDPHAVVALLRSDLPIALYPCATEGGPFAYGRHNCFWKLDSLDFLGRMDPRLAAYCAFALERGLSHDWLQALERPVSAERARAAFARPHNVWEASVWLAVSGRLLVRGTDGRPRTTSPEELRAGDVVLSNELRPCSVSVEPNGLYRCRLDQPTANRWLYDRGDAQENERALREAWPALYEGYRLP